MDSGNKTVNNLLSKDTKLQKDAAQKIISNIDIEAFRTLEEKSEFIFNSIKKRIVSDLILSTTNENLYNLFEFTEIFSDDFKDFILTPLVNFHSEDIKNKFLSYLNEKSDHKKTYSILYFTKIKNDSVIPYAKKFVNSEFEPLRTASIKLLSLYGIKDEYIKNIDIIKSSNDDYEKMKSVEFLVSYGDNNAFDVIYDYFIKSGYNSYIAVNLLFLKNFDTLIKENSEDKIYSIFFSILTSFPDEISYSDFNFYMEGKLTDYLISLESDTSVLILSVLINKLKMLMYEDAYSIDISKDEASRISFLYNKISAYIECFDIDSIIEASINSDNKILILLSVELIREKRNPEKFKPSVKTLLQKGGDDEVIISAVSLLKQKNMLCKEDIDCATLKIKNETLKEQLKLI